MTALFPHVQHDLLCLVALKYYTVNTEKTQKFWMCRSNITLFIQKVLRYRIRIPLSGCGDHLKSSTHSKHAASPLSTCPARPPQPAQSDQSFSSNSESSSESLYSTAMRRDRIVATSFPTGSRLASCSRCSWTFFS